MKVFRLNEYEAWFADSKEAAIEAHQKVTGCTLEETLDEGYFKEYTEQELKEMTLQGDGAWAPSENAWQYLQSQTAKGYQSGFLFGWEW